MTLKYFDIFVTIATGKVDEIVHFYSQILGQKPTVYRAQIYAEFQLDKLRIAIFKPKAENLEEFSNKSSSLSFCLEVENLEQAISYISEQGYPPTRNIITASHGREVYAYDPEGNRLILHQAN